MLTNLVAKELIISYTSQICQELKGVGESLKVSVTEDNLSFEGNKDLTQGIKVTNTKLSEKSLENHWPDANALQN